MIETRAVKDQIINDEWTAREVRAGLVRREIAIKLAEARVDSVEIARHPKTNETLNIDQLGRFRTGLYMPSVHQNYSDILESTDAVRDFAVMTDEQLLNFENDPRLSTTDSWFAGKVFIGTYVNYWRDKFTDKLIQRLEEVSYNLAHQEELFPFS